MSVIEPDGRTMGPDPVAAPEPVAEVPVEEPEAVEEVTETEQETFDRAYVEKLRDEAARYRTRARDYEEAFDGYDDESRAGLLNLTRMLREAPDNPEIQQYLAQMLGFELLPEEGETPDFTEAPQALTREDVAAIAREEADRARNEDQRARAEADAVKDIQAQAKEFGYEQGTIGYVAILKLMNEMEHPDMKQAHEEYQAWRQAEFDAFVAAKEEEARTSPQSPSGNGVAPHMPTAPKSWADARDMLHDRLTQG